MGYAMKVVPSRSPVPDLGAVSRSLLVVLAAAVAGLYWGMAGAATAAVGAAAISGAVALQDSPRGPLRLVCATALQVGLAVLLGTATSSHGALFVLVVTGWCFVAGMQWAVSTTAGLIAAAAGALLVTAPPVEPSVPSVATATLLALGGSLLQAVLIVAWPRRRRRVQRVGLGFGEPTPVPTAVTEHLTRGSPILRHAVRLAAATGLGVAVERFADVPHGYWIPLTVLLVLRPETAHTYTRCAGRIAGNAAGIVLASAVTVIWHPSGLVAAVLAVLVLGITYAVAGFGYLAMSAALAAAIVFLIDITVTAGSGVLADRLLATAIGGGLAILVHVALPDDSLIRLRQRAGELLKTEIDYAATVIKAVAHGVDHPGEALAAAWERAFRARAAFEAAAGATTSDAVDLRRWLKTYRTALNAVTTSCATLESTLPTQPSFGLSRDFVVAVDEYVEALVGGPATPGAPWRIDGDRVVAAEQRLRDAARHFGPDDTAGRVLVAEIGAITRSLVDIPAD